MDPLSQGVLGAAAAQAAVGERLGRRSWYLGAIAGMAPDLDVLIRSAGDPLLAVEFHRHFTHSLAFIPVGGVLVALPFLLWQRRREGELDREQAKLVLAATTVGWATHGLLDAFTSYGTLLWWPFSRARVAWDWISVLDPAYTIILAIGVIWAARSESPRKPALAALLLSSIYMGLCGVQHHRAERTQLTLATLRGDTIVRGRTQPLFLTNLLWRSLYETPDGRMHADTLSLPWWGAPRHLGGAVQPGLAVQEDVGEFSEAERAEDLALFRWFADGWLYADPDYDDGGEHRGEIICDGRYSIEPSRFEGVFCVAFDERGVEVIQRRPDDAGATFEGLLSMLEPGAGERI